MWLPAARVRPLDHGQSRPERGTLWSDDAMSTKVRVRTLIVEERELIASALQRSLSLPSSGTECVGRASFKQVSAQAAKCRPDVILAAWPKPVAQLPVLVNEIQSSVSTVRAAVVLDRCDALAARAALELGIDGVVDLSASQSEFAAACRSLAAGVPFLSSAAQRCLALSLRASGSRDILSAREHEILTRLACGERVALIASTLYLTPRTVRTYIERACIKLDAPTACAAVAVATRRGLL